MSMYYRSQIGSPDCRYTGGMLTLPAIISAMVDETNIVVTGF